MSILVDRSATPPAWAPSPTRRQRAVLTAVIPLASLVVWVGEHLPGDGERAPRWTPAVGSPGGAVARHAPWA